MDAYIDLSYVFSLVNLFTIPYFFKRILEVKVTLLEFISMCLLNIVLYFNAFIFTENMYLNFLFIIVYFFLMYKKKGIICFLVYILAFFSNASYSLLLSDNVYLYNGVILINNPYAIIYSFLSFINLILIECIMYTIKAIKLLSNYKIDIEIELEGELLNLKGYMDSGNTLIKNDLPVIFLNEKYLNTFKYKEMIVNGIGIRKCKYVYGNIFINSNRRKIICAFVNNVNFKGCECLLNINLLEEKKIEIIK